MDTSFTGFLNQKVVQPTKKVAKKVLSSPAALIVPGLNAAAIAYQAKQPISKSYNDYVLTEQRKAAAKNAPKSSTPSTSKTPSAGSTGSSVGASRGTTSIVSSSQQKQKSEKTPEQKYQEDLQKQIQSGYRSQLDFLSSQEQAAQQALPGQLSQIESEFGVIQPQLEAQLKEQQTRGMQQEESLRMQEQQALADTRRRAEEASIRAVQQFGGVGGSSAGQAASELIGREQLRSAGSVQQQRVAGIQDIGNQLRTVQAEYNANVNKLALEKQKALEGVRNQFNQTIKEIQAARMSAGVTKANQTISALQEFAGRRRQIEDQATALQNSLTQARESAALQLQSLSLQNQLQQGSPINYTGFTNPVERGKVISTVIAQVGNNPTLLAQYGLRRLPGAGGGEDLFISEQDGSVYNMSGVQYK
jgi:hypothetical protein